MFCTKMYNIQYIGMLNMFLVPMRGVACNVFYMSAMPNVTISSEIHRDVSKYVGYFHEISPIRLEASTVCSEVLQISLELLPICLAILSMCIAYSRICF
jgi:hypothetical protein